MEQSHIESRVPVNIIFTVIVAQVIYRIKKGVIILEY